MARINYKVDQSLAAQGLLRVAVVAKALKIAPKTVNAWTKYHVSKIGGVKYLNWHEVVADKPDAQLTYGLSNAAMDVYASHVLLSDPQKSSTSMPKPELVTKINDTLAKAKDLLQKKGSEITLKIETGPGTWFYENASPHIQAAIKESTTQVAEHVENPEEILTPIPQDGESDLLTIHPDYKHLLRKVK